MDIFSTERWALISEVAMSELGAGKDSVRKWRERRAVPGAKCLPLLMACARRGVPLSADELLSTTSRKAAA